MCWGAKEYSFLGETAFVSYVYLRYEAEFDAPDGKELAIDGDELVFAFLVQERGSS